MKKYLVLVCFAAALLCRAGVGTMDAVSGNLKVKTDFWSCSFHEGQLFPALFRFPDGTTSGELLFRDSVTGGDSRSYQALDERWAETRILKNTPEELLLECRGGCWRNLSPVISRVPGVELVCRWHFRKDSPEIRMEFTYRNTGRTPVVLERVIAIGWFFRHPFFHAECSGGVISLPRDMRSGRKALVTRDKLILRGQHVQVTVTSPELTLEFPRQGSDILLLSARRGLSLPAGGECRLSAVLTLEQK